MAIDDGLFVDINGVPQWVTLRGRDLANPVLLWLHGGPGFPMSQMAPLFAAWEEKFTIVQWDQPGGGATYAKNLGRDTGPLTRERYVKDGLAVVDYVRSRLRARKIVLMGVSWGTVLGAVMAHQKPELFSAYVGLSQVISGPRGNLLGYQLGLQAAKDRGDAKAVEDLTRVGPPPYHRFEDFIVRQQYTNPPGLPGSAVEVARSPELFRLMFSPPPPGAHYAAQGLPAYDGQKVFLDLQREVFQAAGEWDIASLGKRFATPIFAIGCERDFNTPPALAEAWIKAIRAPTKGYDLLPGASHGSLAFRDEILAILERRVLPLALRA